MKRNFLLKIELLELLKLLNKYLTLFHSLVELSDGNVANSGINILINNKLF